MGRQNSLIEYRHPYANEAKEIVSARLKERVGEWNEQLADLKAKCFKDLWEIKNKNGGAFQLTRNFATEPENDLDLLIKGSLEQIYRIKFNEIDGKLTGQFELSKIEGPKGFGLKGAGGQQCCFRGACVGCPQFRA